MDPPRHPPMIAFLVGMAGIATFSAMDAVMKGENFVSGGLSSTI